MCHLSLERLLLGGVITKMSKFSSLLKRLDKITPIPPTPHVEYIAYWGTDPGAQDTRDFVASWGDQRDG